MFDKLRFLVGITQSRSIMRRYFVVNGFDGALAMLGLTMGFRISDAEPAVAITACVSTAIALGVSGASSAFISESAERKKELRELEESMVADMTDTAHAAAARLIPPLVAIVNGSAPLLISLLIISPLWLQQAGLVFPWPAIDVALGTAFVVIFLLGTFLGRVSGRFWLWSGTRAVLLAVGTVLLILALGAPA